MQATVHEAKTNLSKLLVKVSQGERVVITRHGTPMAELIPARPTQVRLGSLKDKIAPASDAFFDALDEQQLQDWEV